MTKRRIFRLLATIVCAMLGLAAGRAGAVEWDGSYFPNVPLVTHTGETVAFYDDLVAGKIVVINFAYTECPDICSLSTARLAQIYDRLGDRAGRDIFFYTISLDPGTDTPETLAAYAKAFSAGDGWVFLTGTPENVDLVRYKLGERSRSLSEHRSDMVIGNGATGEWRRASVMGSLAIVTQEILRMDPVWRDTPRRISTQMGPKGGYVISDRRGEAFFLKACASCHTIGDGDMVGPDLANVASRRDHGWLVDFMMQPDRMRANGDPVALALDARFAGVRMPNLGLQPVDAEDLLDYIATESAALAAAGPAEGEPADRGAGRDHGEDHAAADDPDPAPLRH